MDEKQTNQIPEENNENNQPPVEKDERDYFERQYFGDALKRRSRRRKKTRRYINFKQVYDGKAKMPTAERQG